VAPPPVRVLLAPPVPPLVLSVELLLTLAPPAAVLPASPALDAAGMPVVLALLPVVFTVFVSRAPEPVPALVMLTGTVLPLVSALPPPPDAQDNVSSAMVQLCLA